MAASGGSALAVSSRQAFGNPAGGIAAPERALRSAWLARRAPDRSLLADFEMVVDVAGHQRMASLLDDALHLAQRRCRAHAAPPVARRAAAARASSAAALSAAACSLQMAAPWTMPWRASSA